MLNIWEHLSFSYYCSHAGLKWDAVPTMIDAPNPPPPLELKRKPPKPRQELAPKKRKINIGINTGIL